MPSPPPPSETRSRKKEYSPSPPPATLEPLKNPAPTDPYSHGNRHGALPTVNHGYPAKTDMETIMVFWITVMVRARKGGIRARKMAGLVQPGKQGSGPDKGIKTKQGRDTTIIRGNSSE
jgi:hypothetical protein